MRKILKFAEQAFTVLSLLLYSGGVLAVIISGGASEGDKEEAPTDFAVIRLIFFVIYFVTFFLLVARWKKVIHLLSKDRFIFVLVGIAVLSILWSFAPTVTINRSIALVGTTLFGLYLASRYSLKQQLQLLGWTFGIAVVLSFVFAVALPKYGIMGGVHAGKWRGIYTHKNVLAKMMVLSAIIFLFLAISDKRNRKLLSAGFCLSIILLLLANSTSSVINLLTLISVFCVLQTLRLRYDLMIPALIAIAIVGGSFFMFFIHNADALLGIVGKDATLTGRTDMWPYVLEKIEQRPWLGYGYSGFWQGLDGESAYVWYAIRWNAPNSHNGYLDLWLNLGLLGLSVFVIGFVSNFIRTLIRVRLSRTPEAVWSPLFMVFTLIANQTETSLMVQNDIFWVLFVAAVFSGYISLNRKDVVDKVIL
jgi:O-antigen ligase